MHPEKKNLINFKNILAILISAIIGAIALFTAAHRDSLEFKGLRMEGGPLVGFGVLFIAISVKMLLDLIKKDKC